MSDVQAQFAIFSHSLCKNVALTTFLVAAMCQNIKIEDVETSCRTMCMFVTYANELSKNANNMIRRYKINRYCRRKQAQKQPPFAVTSFIERPPKADVRRRNISLFGGPKMSGVTGSVLFVI